MASEVEAREFGYRVGLVCRLHRVSLSDGLVTDIALQYASSHRTTYLQPFLAGFEDGITELPEPLFREPGPALDAGKNVASDLISFNSLSAARR